MFYLYTIIMVRQLILRGIGLLEPDLGLFRFYPLRRIYEKGVPFGKRMEPLGEVVK